MSKIEMAIKSLDHAQILRNKTDFTFILLKLAIKRDLRRIFITSHNSIDCSEYQKKKTRLLIHESTNKRL